MPRLSKDLNLSSKMELDTWVSGKARIDTDKVYRYGPMALDTRVTGGSIRRMAEALSGTFTATSTKANGSTTRPTGTARTHMQTELSIRATGRTISRMASELRSGPMVLSTKVST